MVDRRGIEPRPEACKATVLPLSLSAHIKTHLNSPSTLVAISPTRGRICMCFNMVPQVGLEPTRLSALASKTSVATITPPGQTFGCSGWNRTTDLKVMSLARYLF